MYLICLAVGPGDAPLTCVRALRGEVMTLCPCLDQLGLRASCLFIEMDTSTNELGSLPEEGPQSVLVASDSRNPSR